MLSVCAPVTSVTEYLAALQKCGVRGTDPPVWFRGHTRTSHTLLASALRAPGTFIPHEAALLKRFMQDAQGLSASEIRTPWQWLFTAQHYGVPTRLLDWSENALVGLYFACEPGLAGVNPARRDGNVWLLLPSTFNSRLGSWRGNHANDLPMLGVDDFLESYHPFTPPASPQVGLNPVAALAGRSFNRITNQRGTFTVSTDQVPLELLPSASEWLFRISVSGPSMHVVLDELRYLGIEERIIYPDLHRLGARTKALFA